ncbi:MAG: DEAD/DEAH box helicase [Verrucomicrobiota bacterium]
MNPDRATLNFLNSFPEEARKRGERLQKDGAVTQIFGNHLFIQGRVEDESGTFRTSLRLQGNRWFGSCNAEDENVANACQYATMMERMHRGEDLPESPNEFDDTPILDIIEEKLDRELDDKEADFVSKIEKRYRRYVIEGELHDHDMVRITPRWEITTYEPLELWPMPPGDILEFWNYIAYAFFKRKLPYPEFMNVITDLGHVQKKMADWEQEREVASWYERIEQVNERPPQDAPITCSFRLVATINEARLEVKEIRNVPTSWLQLREKNDIENYVALHHEGALLMDAPSQTLWEHFLSYYRKTGDTTLDFDQEESCRFMNRVFRQPALKGYIVNLDEKDFKVVEEALRWACEDDPYDGNSFALQLVTDAGENVSHSVRLLPGRKELYQSDETVFPGPPRWLEETEVMPRYLIPKRVIDSLEGVEFLRKIGAALPESLKKRVVDLELKPKFELKLIAGLTAAETEHLVVDVTAIETKGRRTERLTKDGWELVEQQPVKGKQLLRFAREDLYPVPAILDDMGLSYDEKLISFKSRVTKQFPEKFAEWIQSMPESVELDIDLRLKSILADPVTAAVRFEVVGQDIDWFDLRIVIDVQGVSLSKAQIRQLVAARGGYVRMDDGSWMRLEIKLDADQREAVTRLGLDPFDLSGETHRMHALQLADPKAAEVFDPKAWERIKNRAGDIQLEVTPDLPTTLDATLRPYQLEGFHFLAYLSTNNFGGILADDMGLGKTIQSLTYLLWLFAEHAKTTAQKKPALVVCPKSVLDVWFSEAAKFAPSLTVKILKNRDDIDVDHIQNNIDILVLNYAQLRVCGEELNPIKWLTIILDEGQQIKNPDSKAAKCARELDSQNRLVLTGTPIENRLLDMWSLMAFAMPGVLGSRAYFKKRFDKRKDPLSQTRLASRLRPFLLRRTKLQVAQDLPPRTEEEVYSKMEGVQLDLYKAELKRIQKALLGLDSDEAVKKNSFAILQGLMRLRQICCHPGLIDPKYLKEESAKMESLFYLLDQLHEEGHKVLVFSQFVSMLDLIKARLERDGRPYNYLTGQTKDRKGEIEKFQTTKDPSVFMLSLKAGGAGLNLTSASYVILYDPWWNPAVENQAIDRTHRIGQKSKVIAYRLLTRDTVEEKIRILQHQKTQLVTNVLGDEGFASNLDLDDLQFILTHNLDEDDEIAAAKAAKAAKGAKAAKANS